MWIMCVPGNFQATRFAASWAQLSWQRESPPAPAQPTDFSPCSRIFIVHTPYPLKPNMIKEIIVFNKYTKVIKNSYSSLNSVDFYCQLPIKPRPICQVGIYVRWWLHSDRVIYMMYFYFSSMANCLFYGCLHIFLCMKLN